MKKLLFILLLSVPAFTQTGLPANANRTTFYQEVRAVRDSIKAAQTKYFAANKKYFQGLPSDTLTKDITASLKKFDRSKKPGDQKENWADFGINDISVRGTYTCDVYDGPQGWGYVINVSISYGNDVYDLFINEGPEDWRDSKLSFLKK